VMSCLCWMLMMRCCRRFNLGQPSCQPQGSVS
jgi:hypothetical protein